MQSSIDSAQEIVSKLKKPELIELKSFANPPPKVVEVLNITYLALTHKNPKNYQDCKKMLADLTEIQKRFNAITVENYNQETWKKVAAELEKKGYHTAEG